MEEIFPRAMLMRNEQVLLEYRPKLIAWLVGGIIWFVISFMITIIIAGVSYNISVAILLFNPFGPFWPLLYLLFKYIECLNIFYAITDKRVIILKGTFSKSLIDAGLDRIQNTFVQLGVIDKLLGAGSIKFATAGTLGTEITWEKVPNPMEIQPKILEIMEQRNEQIRGPRTHIENLNVLVTDRSRGIPLPGDSGQLPGITGQSKKRIDINSLRRLPSTSQSSGSEVNVDSQLTACTTNIKCPVDGKIIHSGELAFKCPVCGAFYHPSCVKQHLRISNNCLICRKKLI